MSLPLGVAPTYAVVGGISAQNHEGPGAGNSIFGMRQTDFDRPWLATLSGRRPMQPNIAHQLHRIDADGVVRDPLGSGAEYRHDGFVCAADPHVPTEDQTQSQVYQPNYGYGDLQSWFSSASPSNLDKMNQDLNDLEDTILATPGLSQAQVSDVQYYFNTLSQEYQAAMASGFSSSHPTDASKKYVADAVQGLATYANVYNETDLFPKHAGAINAMNELLGVGPQPSAQGTLLFFLYQVQTAFNGGSGKWAGGNLLKMARDSGYEIDAGSSDAYLLAWPYNFSAIGDQYHGLITDPTTQSAAIAIANQFMSGGAFLSDGEGPETNSNPPWGGGSSGGQPPSIWGTYTAAKSGAPKVVNGVSQFDETLFYAAQNVRNLYLNQQGNGPPPPPPPQPSNPNSGGSNTPTNSDAPYFLAGAAVIAALLAVKAYA